MSSRMVKIEFTLFFNSRNIRSKSIPDTILAWKYFLDDLLKKKQKSAICITYKPS